MSAHRPMSSIDALMFRGESDPRGRTAMVGLYLLDQRPTWQEFRAHMDQASRRFPRLRERVVEATTTLVGPRWVTDPDFDLDYHVRRVGLARPGTFRQVLDLVEIALMAPLDTARPLWEFTLVDGVEGRRAALITKLSHAITDGVGGMELHSVLFDADREAAPRPSVPEPVPIDLTASDITRHALRRLPATLISLAGTSTADVVTTSGRVISDPRNALQGTAGYVGSLRRVLAKPASPSPLIAGRSRSRRVIWTEVALDDLKRAAKSVGGTINDAYLAALTGALARYHDRLGVPVAAVSVAVPVNRRASGTDAGGNQWSAVTLALPTADSNPETQMRTIGESLRSARSEASLDFFGAVAPVLSRLPTGVVKAVLGGAASPADVQASNVPGWPIDTYICGAKVERFIGFGPLPSAAMMVVLLSNAGNCTIGINYDPAAIERPDVFQGCLEESLADVVNLGSDDQP